MDQLQQFILDASLDPPLAERASHAAKLADASAFANFDAKKGVCTDAQRAEMRTFLDNAGLEFDDDGWEELLSRPDVQYTLAAALMEGVVKAKNGPVTVAFMRVRARIELTLEKNPFPLEEEPAAQTPAAPAKRATHKAVLREAPPVPADITTIANTAEVERLLDEITDFDGVREQDVEGVRAALRTHYGRSSLRTFAWLKGMRLRLIPDERMFAIPHPSEGEPGFTPPANPRTHGLRYRIEEVNGSASQFNGVFTGKKGLYVYPLPTELIVMQAADDSDEN